MVKRINPFNPSFGGMPEHFFGRSEHIASIRSALGDSYSPDRVLFFTGNRGCGKTALLERLSQVAHEEGWYVADVHSAHQTGSTIPTDLTDALLARCSSLTGHHGVFLTIDEIQKIPPSDMEEVCAAVQMARRKGLPVALMMAGLPGSKEQVAAYDGCTFMERAQEVRIGSLKVSETVNAFEQLLGLSSDIDVKDGVVWEMASFSQGYPYLMQLVGYHLVRLVRELYPVGTPVARVDHVLDAELASYETYRRDVLVPSLRGIGREMESYLRTMAALLDDRGDAPTGQVAKHLNKSLSQLSACRSSLIKRRLISASARGKVRFALPHLSRYFSEEDDPEDADRSDEWDIR